jgi:hypothetical protein
MSALPPWLATWFRGNDTGTSSKTIAAALAGNATLTQLTRDRDAPHDTSDVGRCVRLLDLAAANGKRWRRRMGEVAEFAPAWAPLLPIWPEIERAYREDVATQESAKRACLTTKAGTFRRRPLPFHCPPSRCWWLVATTRLHPYDPYRHLSPHPFAESR